MTYFCTCNLNLFFILVFHVDAELGKSHYIDNNFNAILFINGNKTIGKEEMSQINVTMLKANNSILYDSCLKSFVQAKKFVA